MVIAGAAARAARKTFVDGTLKPLLDVAKAYKETIYAFDVTRPQSPY